jgi:hypothetical protein
MMRPLLIPVVIAVSVLETMVYAAEPAAAANAKLTLYAPKFEKPPRIDGKLDDVAWVTASARRGKAVVDLNENADTLAATPRIAYLGYDADAIYVAFVIPTARKLTANEKDGGEVWTDDAVEVFCQPKGGGPYAHIGVNVAGAKTIDIKDGDAPQWKTDQVRAAAAKTDTATIIEIAIPFTAVGPAPKSGSAWKMNLAGHEAESGAWLSAAPTAGSFHDAATFLDLVFE